MFNKLLLCLIILIFVVVGCQSNLMQPEVTSTTIHQEPTPIPLEEPVGKNGGMVGGYTFGQPQEITNTRRTENLHFVQWLPESSTQFLLKSSRSLETVNILTGDITQYAQTDVDGAIQFPVWLPSIQKPAFFLPNLKTGQKDLYQGNSNGPPQKVMTNSAPPLIPLETGLLVYNRHTAQLQGISTTGQLLNQMTFPLPDLLSSQTPYTITARYAANQPNGEWVAITHLQRKGIQFFNPETSELQTVSLGGSVHNPIWVMDAKWRPDGQQLALIVTQGQPPVSFSHLYLLTWPAQEIKQIDLPINFVTDTTWATDNRHLLIKGVMDRKDGFDYNELFLMDMNAPQNMLPVPVDVGRMASGFGGTLAWSPDGNHVVIRSTHGEGLAFYRVRVIKDLP